MDDYHAENFNNEGVRIRQDANPLALKHFVENSKIGLEQ